MILLINKVDIKNELERRKELNEQKYITYLHNNGIQDFCASTRGKCIVFYIYFFSY